MFHEIKKIIRKISFKRETEKCRQDISIVFKITLEASCLPFDVYSRAERSSKMRVEIKTDFVQRGRRSQAKKKKREKILARIGVMPFDVLDYAILTNDLPLPHPPLSRLRRVPSLVSLKIALQSSLQASRLLFRGQIKTVGLVLPKKKGVGAKRRESMLTPRF